MGTEIKLLTRMGEPGGKGGHIGCPAKFSGGVQRQIPRSYHWRATATRVLSGEPMKSLHLLYHELRPVKTRYSYVTPCGEFSAHCELFSRLRRNSAGLIPEITFDDGHVSDAHYALPVLGHFGLRATFFITAGWTGTRAGFMDWSELRGAPGCRAPPRVPRAHAQTPHCMFGI